MKYPSKRNSCMFVVVILAALFSIQFSSSEQRKIMPTIAESSIITTPAVAALAEMVNKEETPAAGQEETGKPPAAEGDAIGSADDIVVESKEGEQEDGNAVANTTAADTPDLSSQKQEILNRQEDFDYSAVVYSPEEIETLFPSVPQWLREFLASQPVATHNETLRDPDAKFIVLTCHTFKGGTFSEACGGLSDRLMRLTYYAWVAHNSGRKLLIKWSQPHPLEEFFDVANDFDWRLPDGFADLEWEIYANRSFTQYKGERRIVWHPIISRQEHKDKRFIFANSNIAKIPGAKQMGLENQHEAKGAIFHTLFKPSTKLMELVKSMYVDNPDLKPRSFAAAHVRAKWKEPNDLAILLNKKAGDQIGGGLKMSDPVNKVNVERLADNAANCAKKAMPDTQFIYVASDSDEIPTYLIEESPQWSVNSTTAAPHAKIIARPNYRVESKHLNSNGSPIEAYLGIFLDVWMMSTSQCLAQGLGGFGHLGSELSGNHYSCRVRHRQYGMPILLECPRPGEEMQALRERHNEDKRLAALSVPSSTPSSVPVSPSSAPSSNQTSDQQLNTTITSP
jgi:hypothetical protein